MSKLTAVIYHATTNFREFQPESTDFPDDIYEQLFAGAKNNLAYFGIPLVHLTVKGHPGWGDETVYFDGDPQNVVYNRELFFAEYLKTQDKDQVFWLTEPDARVMREFPELPKDCDLALLRRNDVVAISPWWRLARPSSVPFFEQALQYFDQDKLTWHGDSWAYVKMWQLMNPDEINRKIQLQADAKQNEISQFIEYNPDGITRKKQGLPPMTPEQAHQRQRQLEILIKEKNDVVNNHNYVNFNNMKIELRQYNNYSKPKSSYVRQWKSTRKQKLLQLDKEDWMPKISPSENTSL